MDALPLHERIPRKNTVSRTVDLIVLFLLFSLLVYRLHHIRTHGDGLSSWTIAFWCESWFTFIWILTVNSKWTLLDFKTHPQRLLKWAHELPPVDVFITTADPILEPPIITMNTVLSLLAVDYPAEKLACYISDDGGSPLTYYSLVETSNFAKRWVPFCKKYSVPIRAPFRYFTSNPSSAERISSEFLEEWRTMKEEYKELCQKIENASQTPIPCDRNGDFAVFSKIERRNHPAIVKVIWENKTTDVPNALPHIVYISREKRPKHHHHYKAGAMNVLTRVSGVMTNAPFMLNVDCDMYANNPQIFLQAMCTLLDVQHETDCAFVQFPQCFYDSNQLDVLHEYIGRGIAGIQGPFYEGTGCFHRRRVIYGLSPHDKKTNEKLNFEDLQRTFGESNELIKSAAQILSGSNVREVTLNSLTDHIEFACQVASCSYEYGSSWGTKVGWMYGSTTEDIHTGLTIHGRGWRSNLCMPDPPGFLGTAPSGGPVSMAQQKRWATGLVEILFSLKCPILLTLYGKLRFRQCLAYLWLMVWGLRSVPEIVYAALPTYCIITNSKFLPKVNESAILIPLALFIVFNLYTLSEYHRMGLSARVWWDHQRAWRITAMTAWLFGFLSGILKLLGLSETIFEVTRKDQTTTDTTAAANSGRFTFDDSPIFLPGFTVLLVNLTGLTVGLWRTLRGGNGSGLVEEFVCSAWVVALFWWFLKGLLGRGKYGVPLSTIFKSGGLALSFVYFCNWTSS